MRIIAGRFRGHHLVSFNADHIRPTTDRVKETWFNKLQFDLEGAKVLDLFCGTGNLGLEAVSRGAAHVTFVEKSKQSLEITRKNIEKLKLDKSEYQIVQSDVLLFLKKYEGEGFDIILCDPPFTEKMADEVLRTASISKALKPSAIFATEAGQSETIVEKYGSLQQFWSKQYGDKVLSFYAFEDYLKSMQESDNE